MVQPRLEPTFLNLLAKDKGSSYVKILEKHKAMAGGNIHISSVSFTVFKLKAKNAGPCSI